MRELLYKRLFHSLTYSFTSKAFKFTNVLNLLFISLSLSLSLSHDFQTLFSIVPNGLFCPQVGRPPLLSIRSASSSSCLGLMSVWVSKWVLRPDLWAKHLKCRLIDIIDVVALYVLQIGQVWFLL